jgi:glycine hydroxymethyltransferase
VRDTELIDYERARHVALSARPRLIIAGASAYPRVIDFKRFGEIADEVGAYLLADIAHIAGLVAGGAHPTPVPYADFVTFTTYKTLRGSRGGIILCTKDLARQVDAAVFPGVQGSMHVHLIAAKAVTLKMAMTHQFADYAKQVVANARALSETLAEMGFRIVSGGTDNHIVLVDVRSTTGQSGKQAEEVLSFTGITANRNRIPYDRFGPDIASGIRLGSAALTTRGFRQNEMCEVGRIIGEVLLNSRDRALLEVAKGRARDLAAAYPVLGDRWEVGAHRASVEPEVVPLESAGPSVPDASQKAR